MRRAISTIVVIIIIVISMFIIRDTNKNKHQIQLKKIELNNTQLKLNNLEKSYNKLNTDSKATEQERLKLEEEKKDLQTQLEAKRLLKEQEKVYAASLPVYVGNCGDNEYAHYVYMHESSCSITAVNSIGCVGIGQSCGGGLEAACPDWQTNYDCQNSYFSSYASRRYGGWEQSYNRWLSFNWW